LNDTLESMLNNKLNYLQVDQVNLIGIIGKTLFQKSSVSISSDLVTINNNFNIINKFLQLPEMIILKSQIKFNSSLK
jgi:hypothetical protein